MKDQTSILVKRCKFFFWDWYKFTNLCSKYGPLQHEVINVFSDWPICDVITLEIHFCSYKLWWSTQDVISHWLKIADWAHGKLTNMNIFLQEKKNVVKLASRKKKRYFFLYCMKAYCMKVVIFFIISVYLSGKY